MDSWKSLHHLNFAFLISNEHFRGEIRLLYRAQSFLQMYSAAIQWYQMCALQRFAGQNLFWRMKFVFWQNGCGFQQGGSNTAVLDVARKDMKRGASTGS